MTRAFVAIKPPEPVLDAVARVPVPANARLTTLNAGNAARAQSYFESIERLTKALKNLMNDVLEYERVNNLSPNPGKQDCWQSVTEARRALEGLDRKEIIAKLETEIERLRAALNNIVTRYDTKQDGWHAEDMKEIARRALEGNSGQ